MDVTQLVTLEMLSFSHLLSDNIILKYKLIIPALMSKTRLILIIRRRYDHLDK